MPDVRVVRIMSPDEWKKRQLSTLSSVGQTNYAQGITAPRNDPIAAGIAAQGRYEAQMKKDEVLKRREAGLKATSMNDWAAYAQALGVNRLVEGVQKREKKVDTFIKSFQPLLADHVSKIDAMPDITDADREQRVMANLRGLKALKGKWK